ncbi:hypothetical protein ACGFY7_08955 [Streptomyces prunicolor]|uniref:hypothetical protein n=1 Tax=Streptomyces prunicolor TaxID=67348 RepID=UPI00371CAFFF
MLVVLSLLVSPIALGGIARPGDRPWPELTDQIETVGSARDVLEDALDASGQDALFDTEPASDLGPSPPRSLPGSARACDW